MDYETIRMLGLQDINVDLDKSFITHDKNLTIYNIYLKKPDEVICPVCGRKECNVLGYTSKTIDHSILTSEKAIIKYYSRRYKCKICGKSFELKTLLIQKGHKTSNQTLIMIIDEFRSHTSTFTSIAKKYFLKIQTVINIFEKYIICERQPLPKILCIDEIYTRKLTKNNPYACVMMDFQTRKLVDIVSSRRKDKLSEYFNRISKKERENVKYIVIDMYEPYKQLAALYFKDALVAVDNKCIYFPCYEELKCCNR